MNSFERWSVTRVMICVTVLGSICGLVSASTAPAGPPRKLLPFIGEYGPGNDTLMIYESNGDLFADGMQLHRSRLRRLTGTRFAEASQFAPEPFLDFELADGHATAVNKDGLRLPRTDIGEAVIQAIRAGERSNPSELRVAALRDSPPTQPPATRRTDLVDLALFAPALRFDIRYATSNNFMGFALYERPAAYLQRDAAKALRRAERSLRLSGYGLLVFDGYRPWFVTKMFWDATPVAAHIFVADPSQGSRHNRGCAVDLTLFALNTGSVVEMPSRYDEMSRRSFATYAGGTTQERSLRDLLRRSMERQGFTVYEQEWWHFDYRDWRDYAIGNVTFEQLAADRRRAH